MADDADIPPLEDMTEVLKKAEVIREQKFGSGSQTKEVKKNEDAKKRAKVTKKNLPGEAKNAVVTPEKPASEDKSVSGDGEKEKKAMANSNTTKVNASSNNNQGLFGGMKKGFLFGGPSKQTAKKTPRDEASVKQSKSPTDSEKVQKNTVATSTQKEEIPYITPSGKTDSGLSFDEVQQAMSEAKGLLDNQDWITDDLLNKIEKNDTLLKRFSDPHFMSALQEFQTNPQAAMEKYKGNTEVEKFLMDFCGMLGDHFTNLGSGDPKSQPTSQQSVPKSPAASVPKSKPKNEKSSTKPKIVEIGNDDEKKTPKIVELTDETDNTTTSSDRLKTVREADYVDSTSHIRLHDTQNGADIQEMSPTTPVDEDVKEVLNDPKVMETLMDPRIMSLIKTLREDPEQGQRIVDKADTDLKDKIQFLVSRGLLQFQMN